MIVFILRVCWAMISVKRKSSALMSLDSDNNCPAWLIAPRGITDLVGDARRQPPQRCELHLLGALARLGCIFEEHQRPQMRLRRRT